MHGVKRASWRGLVGRTIGRNGGKACPFQAGQRPWSLRPCAALARGSGAAEVAGQGRRGEVQFGVDLGVGLLRRGCDARAAPGHPLHLRLRCARRGSRLQARCHVDGNDDLCTGLPCSAHSQWQQFVAILVLRAVDADGQPDSRHSAESAHRDAGIAIAEDDRRPCRCAALCCGACTAIRLPLAATVPGPPGSCARSGIHPVSGS